MAIFFKRMTYRFFLRNCYERLRWILLYTYTNITETIFFQVFSVYYTYIKPTQCLHLTYTISTLNEWVADSWPARRHAPEVLEACS